MEENKDDEKNVWKKKEIEKLVKNIMLFLLMILVSIFIINFHRSTSAQKEEKEVDFSGINKICELSTLRCYYHNVAELKEEPDEIFKYGWFRYGFKKLWIEYNGMIDIGIDANKVQVNEPDKNNVVYVYVPDAMITSVSVDTDSMTKSISDAGVFTKITMEDKNQAFVQGQQEIEQESKNDKSISNRAKDNAQKLIEQYIINVGNQIGKQYKVKWLSKPKSTKENEKV